MKLIIAEKPELGRAIAGAIEGREQTQSSVIYKGEYAVVWAYGHLLELKMPQDYDGELAKWTLDALPIYFPDWEQKPKASKGDSAAARLRQIGELLKKCEYVIHAGDPDEEGQYLIDEILRWHKYSGKVYRMNTNDTTPAALQRALKALKDNTACENTGWSAYARSVADLMVGVNLSRYFTLKNPGVKLTIGRVQTPTLGLVVMRDQAIESHTKQKYYIVHAKLSLDGIEIDTVYEPAKDDANLEDGKILDITYAQNKTAMLENETFRNAVVTYKELTEQPPLPFNLTELQTFCSNKYGYDPMQVLDITQRLRDNFRAITYNRSDCQYLSEEQYKLAPGTIQQVAANLGVRGFKGLDAAIHSRCFDDSRITAHTAIIPQNTQVDINAMSEEERNVYKAICQYYIAQFYPPAKKGRTTLTVPTQDSATLKANSTIVIFPGYLFLFSKDKAKDDDAEEDSSELSKIQPGTYTADVVGTSIEEKQTKPPARYTKASLNKDMTRIAKFVKDEEAKKLLLAKDKDKEGENGSIGTVATRPDIIERLVEHKYLEVKGKQIISTPLGRELYRILPNQLREPDMTAFWWAVQEDIKEGNAQHSTLTDSVLDMICHVIHTEYPQIDISGIPNEQKKEGARSFMSLGLCPRCGHDVIEGKTAFGCSNYKNGCKFKVWKRPPEAKKDTALTKKYEISSDMMKWWLQNGWHDEYEADETGKRVATGRKLTIKTIQFRELYAKNKDSFFDGYLVLADDLKSEWGADFKIASTEEMESLGVCPRCGGEVKEGKYAFACERYSKTNGVGCKFIIWKQQRLQMLSNYGITAANVKAWLEGEWSKEIETDENGNEKDTGRMLSHKAVSFKKLLKKNGEEFSGRIYLADKPNNEYGPDFKLAPFTKSADSKPDVVLGKCPRCGGDVVQAPRGFYCNNRESGGCNFGLWKKTLKANYMLSKTTITAADMRVLLAGEGVTKKTLLRRGGSKCIGTLYLRDDKEHYGAYLCFKDGTRYFMD